MKHSSDNKFSTTTTIGIIIALLAVVLFISGIVMFFVSNKPASPTKNPPKTPSSATVPSSTSGAATKDSAVPSSDPSNAPDNTLPITEPTTPSIEPPKILQDLLSEGGINLDEITDNGTKQLIVVKSNGNSADIKFFERTGKLWKEDTSLSFTGYVGSEGTINPDEMSEEHEATPQGLYSIGEAFYQNNVPATGLSAFQITSGTYWVDDPESQFYNQRVKGTNEKDWNSAEDMANIPNYRYGFVINYNTECIPNKGSAIFFHVGSEPTQGCVSTSEDNVLAYLSKLEDSKNPYILII